MKHIEAPFTPEQVKNLNEYQSSGVMHEFTCANDHDGKRVLIAKESGWECPTCDYKQNWAHEFMADPEVLEKMRDFKNGKR